MMDDYDVLVQVLGEIAHTHIPSPTQKNLLDQILADMARRRTGANPLPQRPAPAPHYSPAMEIPTTPHTGIITGYRRFNYTNGLLQGMFGPAWTMRTSRAVCNAHGKTHGPSAPHLRGEELCPSITGSGCGIYILKSPRDVEPGGVFAECVGWGAYVEHEHGWRVEWARIERLWLGQSWNPAIAQAMSEYYGVPVEHKEYKL